MSDVPNCPICKRPLDGPHMLDCHWKGMSRESRLFRLIPSPILSPDGKSYKCSECGAGSSCAKCSAIFDAIEYEKARRADKKA